MKDFRTTEETEYNGYTIPANRWVLKYIKEHPKRQEELNEETKEKSKKKSTKKKEDN